MIFGGSGFRFRVFFEALGFRGLGFQRSQLGLRACSLEGKVVQGFSVWKSTRLRV